MEKINVIIKRSDSKPYSSWISNNLKNLQRLVGGYIETVGVFEDCVVICNEEGRLQNLPYNCEFCGIDFVGDIIFVGVKGDEFVDLPVDYKTFKRMFPKLWEE